MRRGKLLIVEDERIARENLDHVFKQEGYDTVAVASGVRACDELDKQEFDLVMTDLRMQPVDGMQVLKHTKTLYPGTEVIMITSYATVSLAVEAMQQGAYHYLPKPYKIEEMRLLVAKAMEKRRLYQEVTELKRQVQSQKAIPLLVGNTPQIDILKAAIEQIAPSDATVLIQGERGTGKELVARLIHHLSPRADQRFLAITCGAFSEAWLAAELFGHDRKALAGGREVKKGLLEAADGGTVLLDEIGALPDSLQRKLLRVLKEKTLRREGGTADIPVDLRILAASHEDVSNAAATFRQDLYHHINMITLNVPRLAERQDDIPLLCRHFLEKFARAQGKPIWRIAGEVMETLLYYQFPGNIRELENIMERAVTLCSGNLIEMRHLPLNFQQASFQAPRHPPRQLHTLEEQEKDYIAWVLAEVQGNKSKAAKILGIDRVSLWRKMKRHALSEEE
jgi:DNA-binding NtrC family response regulator